MVTRYEDLTGLTFGRLNVLSLAPYTEGSRHARWYVQCVCGNAKIVAARHLKSGQAKSCGCLAVEQGRINALGTHGQERVEVPTYSGIHMRLRSVRGPAFEHMCECGSNAEQWAYQWNDPNELLSPNGMPYSLDLEGSYAPMCAKCHKNLDVKHGKVAHRVRSVA